MGNQSSTNNHAAQNSSKQATKTPGVATVSPLAEVEQTLKTLNPDSLQFQALNNLKTLGQDVEGTIDKGVESFGKGVFKLFDFVRDSLPEQDVSQLRYYNRRSFAVFDKYLQLREVQKDVNDHMRQLIIGLSSDQYAPLKDLIIKGAVKGYDDQLVKYKACKSIEQVFEGGTEKIGDFFEVIYEKFEKQIESFFDKRGLVDTQEANTFYKMRTKFLERKVKGLQQQVVKQNFELRSTKMQCQQDVSLLQSEIGEIKKDFSQTLNDVKTSMVNYGLPADDDVASTPDIEFMNNSGDDFILPQAEEEKLSTISKHSYSNTNTQQYNQSQLLASEMSSNQPTQRSRNSNHKYDNYDSSRNQNKSTLSRNSGQDLNYDNVPARNEYYYGGDGRDSRRKEHAQTVIDNKKPPLRHTYTFNNNYYQQQLQNPNLGAYTTAAGTRDSHNQSQDLNSSRQSRGSRGSRHQHQSAYYQTVQHSQTYQPINSSRTQGSYQNDNQNVFRRHRNSNQNDSRGNAHANNNHNTSVHSNGNNSSHNNSQIYSRRSTYNNRAGRNVPRSPLAKQDSVKSKLNYCQYFVEEQPKPVIQHTVSDDDFSNILGGALYLQGSTVEIMSECSQPEDENNKNSSNKMAKLEEIKGGDLKKRATTQNIFKMDGQNFGLPRMTLGDNDQMREQIIEEKGNLMKRAQSQSLLPQINIMSNSTFYQETSISPSKDENNHESHTLTRHVKKMSKFSLTFCNPSPAESRDCSKERPGFFSQAILQQQVQNIMNAKSDAAIKLD